MKTITLILREAAHRRLNAVLSLLAIVTAVSLFVAFFTTGQGAARETRRLMRDIGLNLRIIPRQTDMERFWASGYSEHTMPEEYVQRLATHEGLSYAHLSATLQRRMPWRGREIVLTGILPELEPPNSPKTPMFRTIEPGDAHVGAAVAAGLQLRQHDRIEIGGQQLNVARLLPETGSLDDIRVYINLRDAQRVLQLEGQVNEIRALQCLCLVDGVNVDSMAVLRAQLQSVLPAAKVVRLQAIADAREQQRVMVQRFFAFVMPLVVVVCMVWIGVLALLNVRERTSEIGILRALGYGSGKIATLFLGKAVMIGLVGALLGYGAGTVLALRVGAEIFAMTAAAMKPSLQLLLGALWMAPLFCALAAFVPTMWAVAQDPARILREV
jgi:putative ABC transport system permease protein